MSASPLGRVLEIATPGHRLNKERGFLVVRDAGGEVGRVPLEDISAVVFSSPGASVSTNLLADLAERGVPSVFCSANYAPVGVVWSLSGHHRQQRRMEEQIAASRPLKKRLWAMLVAGKIRGQAAVLDRLGTDSAMLHSLARRVRSGDPGNLEAQAARLYWSKVFGPRFRRDRNGPWPNALLNYGYMVLRAAVARSIVSVGLHPGLGIFHRHPHNALPLSDDLIEPFRPAVDWRVATLQEKGVVEIGPEAKREVVGVLLDPVRTQAGLSPLGTAILRCSQSLAASYEGGKPLLDIPLAVVGDS